MKRDQFACTSDQLAHESLPHSPFAGSELAQAGPPRVNSFGQGSLSFHGWN